MSSIEPVEASVTVPVPPEQAWTAFVGGFGRWWPREYSWSGPDHLADIGISEVVGGTLWEVGALGVRWDWGVVLLAEPHERLVTSWQIGPDRVPVPHPDGATRVEVRLVDRGGATRVTVRHDRFEVHGDAGAPYRDGMDAAWPLALDAYATSLLT